MMLRTMHIDVRVFHQFLHNLHRIFRSAFFTPFKYHFNPLCPMAFITHIMPVLTPGMALKLPMAHHALHLPRLLIIYNEPAAYQAGSLSSLSHTISPIV